MRDCKDCKHFDGYDHSDGTPYCTYENDNGDSGYEVCPFNDTAETKANGLSCTVDLGRLDEYIAETIANTVMSRVNVKIDSEITSMVKKAYDDNIRKKTEDALNSTIADEITKYMSGDITIGGGWGEPSRTISRNEYLSETISKELNSKFKTDYVSEMIVRSVKTEIEKRTDALKQQINAGIKSTFDEVTRKTLAENVVNMLMCSDTYTKLQNGMTQLLK